MSSKGIKRNLDQAKGETLNARTVAKGHRTASNTDNKQAGQNQTKTTESEKKADETTNSASEHKDVELEFIVGDLFSCDASASLCHCVSADLAMGKGIAVQFKRRFGQVAALKAQSANVGQAAVIPKLADNAFVYYLVTKKRYFQKPTLASVRASCVWMKDHAVENQVELIAMPLIACGLDRLQWPDVEEMLVDVFAQTGIKLQVYSLA